MFVYSHTWISHIYVPYHNIKNVLLTLGTVFLFCASPLIFMCHRPHIWCRTGDDTEM